jgi:4-amino-4-deoxy-L-arabinose transferase-like glycosyltransferase
MRHRVGAVPQAPLMAFLDRHFFKFVLALLAAFGGLGVRTALGRWRELSGYEPEQIAEALASGHGYSFAGAHRWLFVRDASEQYFPTAWSDPAFTVLYAAIISLFGDGSRLVIILLLLACFLVSAALVAVTARRLAGPLAGLLALLALFVMVRGSVVGISAPALAGLWVALLLSLLVAYAGRLSLRRAFILGAVLGISVLTWSTTMVFVPVVVLFLFWLAPTPWSAARMLTATVLTAMLIVAPWSARNYAVFDELVPVRNGLGHLAHLGTIGLSATFAPEHPDSPVPAPLTTSGPFDAVASVGSTDPIAGKANRSALAGWQMDVMPAQIGERYGDLNEAQRDKWLFAEARNFVNANPFLTIQPAAAKVWEFLWLGRSSLMAPLTIFGLVVGSVLAIKERRLLIPLATALAYIAPFVIIIPFFYRYRYPIEPVIAVLVGVSLARVAEFASRPVLLLQPRGRGALAAVPPGAAPAPRGSTLERAARTRQSHAI